MSRQLKRVALDFDWPLHKIWVGYKNPYYGGDWDKLCDVCGGQGYSKEGMLLFNLWYFRDVYLIEKMIKDDLILNTDLLSFVKKVLDRYYHSCKSYFSWSSGIFKEDIDALLKADRLWNYTRVPINEEQVNIIKKRLEEDCNSWLPFNNGYVPTEEDMIEFGSSGHDACNCAICINNRLEMWNLPKLCSVCEGSGRVFLRSDAKELQENWKDYDPPKGEGYQLWETTSEGSPISPVFNSFEELCDWCEFNANTFGPYKATKEQWKEMLEKDFVYHKEGNIVYM